MMVFNELVEDSDRFLCTAYDSITVGIDIFAAHLTLIVKDQPSVKSLTVIRCTVIQCFHDYYQRLLAQRHRQILLDKISIVIESGQSFRIH